MCPSLESATVYRCLLTLDSRRLQTKMNQMNAKYTNNSLTIFIFLKSSDEY